MEEEMHVICEQGRPRECELVWVKEEVLAKQEVNDLQPEIKGKLTSYLERNCPSSDQYKEGEITEEREAIPQVWIKQEIKQECHDPSQATDEQKLQSENMTDSSDENVQNGDEWKNEEETELEDIKSGCETVHMMTLQKKASKEQELCASDVQLHLETMKIKHCCSQGMLLGKNCDICKKPTDSQSCVYKCEICDKVFAKKYRLASHINVHGDKNFQCDICLKRFVHSRTLTKHKTRVHCVERKFHCPTCGKQFKTNYELTLHLVSHSSERKYACSLCNKLFTHQRRLTIHQRTHTDVRKYKCGVCSRRFSRHTGLVEHERLHTGEKPFKCALCEKEFLRRSSLLHHELLHTGVKPHKCDECQKQFYRRYHLVRHLRGHLQSRQSKSTESS